MTEVFLSHASRDHRKARRLKKVVEDHGVSVWFSPHSIRGAQAWQDEIGAALGCCDWFMILITPSAVKSMWVRRELEYALAQQRYDGHIIPLIFKQCDVEPLSWALPQIQAIDFTEDFWKGCDHLLRIGDQSLIKPARRKRPK